jgi:hypothetical protein
VQNYSFIFKNKMNLYFFRDNFSEMFIK